MNREKFPIGTLVKHYMCSEREIGIVKGYTKQNDPKMIVLWLGSAKERSHQRFELINIEESK